MRNLAAHECILAGSAKRIRLAALRPPERTVRTLETPRTFRLASLHPVPVTSDRAGKDALGPGGLFNIDYGRLLMVSRQSGASCDGDLPLAEFGRAIESEWGWLYERETPGPRDVRAFTIGTFTWLWDATMDIAATDPDNRMIGVYGTSVPPQATRDKSRMAGFPLNPSGGGSRVHRGHAIGHSLGGPDEGYNLFTQDAGVNLGREWRALERYCASRPGTFLFVRCVYSDISSIPSALEFGVLKQDSHLDVRYFTNTAGLRPPEIRQLPPE